MLTTKTPVRNMSSNWIKKKPELKITLSLKMKIDLLRSRQS